MKKLNSDIVAGIVFLTIAAAFGYQSLQYEQGTFFRMGAGLFPATVSLMLFALGAMIVVKGAAAGGVKIGTFSARSIVLVLLAPIVFALTIEGAGLVVSASILVLMSSFASKSMTVRRALGTTIVLVAMAVGIFIWGLHLPVSVFGTWFTGEA